MWPNIEFKSFSLPDKRFFNSAIVCYSLFKVSVTGADRNVKI